MSGVGLTSCNSIAIGTGSLKLLCNGAFEIAIGYHAGCAICSGGGNIAIGKLAMAQCYVTGTMNIALGHSSMRHVTTGYQNLAIGEYAICGNTTGCHNLAIGYNVMGGYNMQGYYNIGMGREAGYKLCTGLCNVMFGLAAGKNLTTGCNNVLVGAYSGCNADCNMTTQNHYIMIGDNQHACAMVTTSWAYPSDCRDKRDVSDLDLGLDYIKALRPVYYRWDKRGWYDAFADGIETDEDRNLYINYKTDGSKKREKWMIGLLAQEALAAEKLHTDVEQCSSHDSGCDMCDEGILVTGTNDDGYRMSYDNLIMPLINASQELDAKIVALTTRVATLEG